MPQDDPRGRHRLARGRLESRRRDAVRAVARARARRTASAAVDDHAARLARARADLQGSAGAAARKRTWPPTASSAIRCCRAPTSCCTGRPSCRSARIRWRTWRSRARSRAASITCTAASRTSSRRPSAPSRSSAAATSRSTGSCGGASRKPATRRRSSARARWSQSNTRITVADRERLLGYLEGSSVSILPEPQVLLTAAPEGAGARWPQDVQVLRQYHRAARGSGCRWRRSCAPCRPIRRACGAPIRAIRRSARCGICTEIYSDDATRQWAAAGLPHRRHRLPGLQEAADRAHRRGGQRHAQAGAGIPGQSRAGSNLLTEGARRPARPRARRSMRCAARCTCGP